MNRLSRLVLTTLVVVASAASAQAATVRYDYDRSTDFTSFKTFAWKEAAKGDSLTETRLRTAVTTGFTAKSYSEAQPEEADFLLAIHTAAHRELRIDEGFGPRWRNNLRVASFPVGTLVVDVFNRETGKLVWRGSVSDALASDPAKADKKTAKAVAKLLKKFPPPG